MSELDPGAVTTEPPLPPGLPPAADDAVVVSFSDLLDRYSRGVWCVLANGGRFRIREADFERSGKAEDAQLAYRKTNGLSPDAALPNKVMLQLNTAQALDLITDFDSFAGLESRDGANLHVANLKTLLGMPIVYGDFWEAYGELVKAGRKAQEEAAKN